MSARAAATQAAVAAPASATALAQATGLQRQCACGGSAGFSGACPACRMKKLLGQPLQAKLQINEPGDQYEQEADRVAERVMQMPDGEVNRQRRAVGTPLVQRRATSGGTGVMEAPAIVHDVVNSPGQPLDAATRAFFEPRFGHDFSQVRVHCDDRAAVSARVVSAHAYTVGDHVVFGAGRFAPETRDAAVLVRTDFSQHWRTERHGRDNPFLTAEACEVLARSGAAFVGIDSLNIDDIADLGGREQDRPKAARQQREPRRLLQLLHGVDRRLQVARGDDRAVIGEQHRGAPAGKSAHRFAHGRVARTEIRKQRDLAEAHDGIGGERRQDVIGVGVGQH